MTIFKRKYSGKNSKVKVWKDLKIFFNFEHNQKTVQNLERTIKTNFNGNFNLMEKVYPLAKQNARIVFVSSIFSLRAMYSLGTGFKLS